MINLNQQNYQLSRNLGLRHKPDFEVKNDHASEIKKKKRKNVTFKSTRSLSD